ncbi:hypothetical protein MAPG_09827, partial [Magnaporthiopsis poae ATCC 64411]|uniref:Uncharacterized protein n=1 Tax=Magnaporthiopsis poae (strain ATCC 64411 / 73-15) TaxID=644358 RepID=A0A0C4EAZ0_MAGP6
MAWLLFPVAVAAVRRAARWVLLRARPETAAPSFHLEASRRALLAVYGLPTLFSAGAHVWGLVVAVFGGAGPDDRREMTRSTLRFVELDAVFVGLTVLYWVLVEGGWRPAAIMALVSAVLGPGAGVCAAWVWREWTAHSAGLGADGEDVEGGQDGENPEREGAAEDTPLLR